MAQPPPPAPPNNGRHAAEMVAELVAAAAARPPQSTALALTNKPLSQSKPKPPPPIDGCNRVNPVAVRNAPLIASPLFADMFFYIEQDAVDIAAHRMIVCTASPVFEKFLSGTGTLPASDRITVSDISAERFREVLRYIYTDEVAIDPDNALDVLRCANYFDLADLEDKCVETVLRTLTIYNVCALYPQTYQLSARLAAKCVQLIQAKTDWLLDNGELFGMPPAAFSEILKLDQLNVRSEKSVYVALLKWACDRCEALGWTGTAKNRRSAMGDRLALVRFTTMELNEFMECLQLEPTFFSTLEVADISRAIRTRTPAIEVQLLSNVRRVGVRPEIKTSQLFHWCSRGSNYRNFPPEQFSVRAVAPVLVYGIGMYGRNGLHICDAQKQPVALREVVYDDETELSRLMFAEPFVVKPEELHHQFTAHHDAAYGKFFYFFQMEYKERRNVYFGYNFSTAYTNKYIRVVEIYYEDLV